MLHEVLKNATRPDHDELERLMFVNQIMDGTLSFVQYQQILAANFMVHQQYEEGLFINLSYGLANALDMINRQKLPALEADMQQAGITTTYIMDDTPFPLTSDAAMLGALYVLEGATLGGSVIVKRLKVNPNLNNLGLNFNYYQVYGESLIPNWRRFCAVLDKQPEDSFENSIQGAKLMFGYIAASAAKANAPK